MISGPTISSKINRVWATYSASQRPAPRIPVVFFGVLRERPLACRPVCCPAIVASSAYLPPWNVCTVNQSSGHNFVPRRASGRSRVTPNNTDCHLGTTKNNSDPSPPQKRARIIWDAIAPWLFNFLTARSSENAWGKITKRIQCITCPEKGTMLDKLDKIWKYNQNDCILMDQKKKKFSIRLSCRFLVAYRHLVLFSLLCRNGAQAKRGFTSERSMGFFLGYYDMNLGTSMSHKIRNQVICYVLCTKIVTTHHPNTIMPNWYAHTKSN